MKITNSYLENAQWRMNYAKAMCITVYRIIDIHASIQSGGGGHSTDFIHESQFTHHG